MPLSWNEIRHRAISFATEWTGETREAAERQTFWNEFFNVFGIRRRTVATFEEPVKKLSGSWGSIDLFWPGKLLVEHKSAGQDLGKAHAQAMAYIRGLKDSARDREIPRWIIVTDFARIALHDLEPEQDPTDLHGRRLRASVEFPLADLHKHIRHFAFIAGYTQHRLDPEDPANLEATQLMCSLHDALEAGGYTGHELKRFLVRILFCLFAEDTGIFPQKAFELFILDRTRDDGSDLGVRLEQLFRVLNTDVAQRQTNLDEDLGEFPYVNGDLFAERLDFADFDADMRNGLLACCRFRWDTISPAVFGSLFQAVMDDKERRQIGAHYTAEKNILKLVRSLFLDDLRAEFERLKTLRIGKSKRLGDFQDKLSKLCFLDPACGCGNFLVLTYRELRKLELEVLIALHGGQHEMTLDDANKLSKLNVHQFYGIEVEEFPARIAEVALWLADHQANIALSQAFSQLIIRLPLRASPHIVVANALRIDWRDVIPATQCSFVLGNPPFVGKTYMTHDQRADVASVWGHVRAWGILDYVCAWYWKAAEYSQRTAIRCALVSTSSISQGEQPGILWGELFGRFGLKIHFAHRAFPWESEARGRAHVHVVIIGFGGFDISTKRIFDYDDDPAQPSVSVVPNISPYLVAGSDFALPSRTHPLSDVPAIINGSKQVDGGFLTLGPPEKERLLHACPDVAPYVRAFVGSEEFINDKARWCLWLVDAPPSLIRNNPELKRRIEGVRQFRRDSKKAKTREGAATPTLFGEIRPVRTPFLAIPEVSSERRKYIPVGFLEPTVVPSNKIHVVPDATLYHFGIISSAMHMAWMRQVTGRLDSRYSYSAKIVYNNFPWPSSPSAAQCSTVNAAAQAVLDARATFPAASLAELYDPLAMPSKLSKAHAVLDHAVDRCYRKEPFASDRARVEFLFQLYEHLTAPLLPTTKVRRGKRSRT